MSVKTKGLLGDINKANVLHKPVQVKNLNFNSYIYIFIVNPTKFWNFAVTGAFSSVTA